MAKTIGIMGTSGSGKTTSLRNLPPNETFIIDADGKGLSWKEWKKDFNAENKNYWKSDYPDKILDAMQRINDERPDIKYLVVDTLNGIMVGDEIRRMKEKGYDKWQELSASVFNIVDGANRFRDDLTVIFTAHAETVTEDSGYVFTRILTSGKKLSKIMLESKLPTVLLAKAVDGKYLFETQANNSTAKSPMGAIDDVEIPNDIMIVIEALKDY